MSAQAEPGLGPAARNVAEHASALVRLEVELAVVELRRKLAALGAGVGLAVAAGVLALFALGFALAAAAAALALVMPTWLALLIVTGALLVVAGVLVLVARSMLRKATPPVPEEALREVKMTTDRLRNNGH